MKLRSVLGKSTKKAITALLVIIFILSSQILVYGKSGSSVPSRGVPKNTNSYQNRYIKVQILGINDFHGQINTTKNGAGRADYLAAYIKQHESENKNTLKVHAGDVVGASAPASALLQDEPTIEILNKLQFDVGTLGNHEFDEGKAEMMRLIYGGSHPATGDFEGANFPYVAANVVDTTTKKTILPSYVIKKVNGMPIGFIGIALPETPSIVTAGATAGLEFTNPAEAVNKAVKELQSKKVKAIVVLAHMDGYQKDKVITGNIAAFAESINDEVDVIFAGHNHGLLNGFVDGKLIVESNHSGLAFSDVDLEIDPYTKDIVTKKAEIVTTTQKDITPDAEISALIAKYEGMVGPVISKVIGTASTDIIRAQNAAGESSLGNLIADAQRAEMKTDFAFMNPGGIRADISSGEVTWGELFTVQPFYNSLVKMDLTGQQIRDVLNQQFGTKRMLQISGLKYTYDPLAKNVINISLTNGTPIDPAKVYTVTVNNFLAGGGDGFSAFTGGKNLVYGPFDIDALVNYISSISQPFSASIEGRITTATP